MRNINWINCLLLLLPGLSFQASCSCHLCGSGHYMYANSDDCHSRWLRTQYLFIFTISNDDVDWICRKILGTYAFCLRCVLLRLLFELYNIVLTPPISSRFKRCCWLWLNSSNNLCCVHVVVCHIVFFYLRCAFIAHASLTTALYVVCGVCVCVFIVTF